MRQILSKSPKGFLSITNPVRSLGDENMTDAEVEARALDHMSTKYDPPHTDVKFASANTVLNATIREFRDGLDESGGVVSHDIPKCILLAHGYRRKTRDKDMKPWDDIVSKDIPGQDRAAAEVERKKIRDADAIKQTTIDNSTTVEQLKAAVGEVIDVE